ncbi:hypothetical protein BC941DRAFT_514585 [Chlamydoabsidia padenii]|nr:hypothetical protein BC941DRAFT_514585 [Chlamydoabsidia padenii]
MRYHLPEQRQLTEDGLSEMDQDIALMKDKVAVVTGGSRGIGFAVCEALIARGAKVVIGDILEKEGQQAVDVLNKSAGEKRVAFQYCDVRKYDDLKKLFQLAESQFGGVDIAILNAGISTNASGLLDPMDDESERLIHDVNVGGVIKGNKVAIMHMMKRKGGIIVNTASVAGIMGFGCNLCAYSATKHAVIGWTRSLEHLQHLNIRVNTVCPYWTETEMIKSPDKDWKKVMDKVPKVPMKIVVEAFLTCIRNENYSGEAIIAAPGGLIEHPRSSLPESCISTPLLEVLGDYEAVMLKSTAQRLQETSNKYFNSLK